LNSDIYVGWVRIHTETERGGRNGQWRRMEGKAQGAIKASFLLAGRVGSTEQLKKSNENSKDEN
jgi:hypothetical protein